MQPNPVLFQYEQVAKKEQNSSADIEAMRMLTTVCIDKWSRTYFGGCSLMATGDRRATTKGDRKVRTMASFKGSIVTAKK